MAKIPCDFAASLYCLQQLRRRIYRAVETAGLCLGVIAFTYFYLWVGGAAS